MLAAIKSWFKKVFSHPVLLEAPPSPIPEPIPGEAELPSAEDKGKVRLGVIIGHTADAPGATMAQPYGHSEYYYNGLIAAKMQKWAKENLPQVEVEIIRRDGIGISGAYAEARKRLCDCAIELHFNAFNGLISGTEALCTPEVSDMEFAQIVHRSICSVFGRQGASRGVKAIAKSARGGGNVHSFPGGANCLIEPFFGDNRTEAALAMEKSDEYAEALVKAVALWARNVDLLH